MKYEMECKLYIAAVLYSTIKDSDVKTLDAEIVDSMKKMKIQSRSNVK
jgi:hypothetical protein